MPEQQSSLPSGRAVTSAFRLADAHRLAQARLGAQTVGLMGRLFSLLDVTNLRGTMGRWLAFAVPMVTAQAARSARLAVDYLTASHELEFGLLADPFAPVPAAANPLRTVTSLRATGPMRAVRLLANEFAPATVRRITMTAASRSAMRLALDGGRETIVNTMRRQPRAGWSRVTSGQPCAFCAMLAGRGPVYTGEHAAAFQAHDSCACAPMAVWNRNEGWTPQALEYGALWHEIVGDLSGDDALNAFRRVFETSAAGPR